LPFDLEGEGLPLPDGSPEGSLDLPEGVELGVPVGVAVGFLVGSEVWVGWLVGVGGGACSRLT
jgi:hypothetical protein